MRQQIASTQTVFGELLLLSSEKSYAKSYADVFLVVVS